MKHGLAVYLHKPNDCLKDRFLRRVCLKMKNIFGKMRLNMLIPTAL